MAKRANENINGLLREYIPKSMDVGSFSDEEISSFIYKRNTPPYKCLNWKILYEFFYNTVLHLT